MTDHQHRPYEFPAHRALEMRMRSALDALEEFATTGLDLFDPGCVQILSIERPMDTQAPESTRTVGGQHPAATSPILPFPAIRR